MSHRNISEPEKPIKYKIGVKYHVQVHERPGGGGGGGGVGFVRAKYNTYSKPSLSYISCT